MANGLWTSALRLSQSRSDLYRLRAFRLHAHTHAHFSIYNLNTSTATSTWYFSTTRITSRTRRWNIAGKSFQKQVNNSLSGKYSVLIMLKSPFKSSYSLWDLQKNSSFCTQSRAEIYTDCIRLLLAWAALYFYFLLHFIMFGWFDYPEYVWSFEMLIPKEDKPGLFLGSCSPPAFSSCTERSLKIRSSFLKMKTCFLTQKQMNHLKKPSL